MQPTNHTLTPVPSHPPLQLLITLKSPYRHICIEHIEHTYLCSFSPIKRTFREHDPLLWTSFALQILFSCITQDLGPNLISPFRNTGTNCNVKSAGNCVSSHLLSTRHKNLSFGVLAWLLKYLELRAPEMLGFIYSCCLANICKINLHPSYEEWMLLCWWAL